MDKEKLDGLSLNIEQTERDKLRAVFPQCFAEGKLDIDKLLTMCGEYITDDFEKYEFKWKGKSECLQLAQKRSTGTLRPCKEESINFDTTQNLYIEGDNLEVLKLLQTSYYRKVKMIYIDPPYNTGNDFVYEDDYADPIARYKEITSQTTKSNPETMGRFHTNWLNMMYPRLRLAANLLRDDGICFISIDDNEVHNLRKLCDEVFGEENFVAQIPWIKRVSPANDSKWYSGDHEYIVIYAKIKEIWRPQKTQRTEEHNSYYKNPDNDPRGDWNSAAYTCNKSRSERPNLYYAIINPNTGEEIFPDENAVWAYSYEVHLENIRNNLLYWGMDGKSKSPRRKKFLSEAENVVPRSHWHYNEVGSTQTATTDLRELFNGAAFPYPKPVKLLHKMVYQATSKDDNDIILDFFSGSATTAHAVMQLNAEDGGNRRFIMVQLPELCDEKSEAYKAGYKNICEIGKERIRRAGEQLCEKVVVQHPSHRITKWEENGEQMRLEESTSTEHWTDPDNPPCDIGFRVFKLDESNLKIWDNTPIPDGDLSELERRLRRMLDIIKDNRSNLDVVYEVMLKLGQDLCEDIAELDINEKTVYGIGADVAFIVCFAEHITPEDAESMAEYAPGRIIFAEQCFDNTTDKSNVKLTLRDRGINIKML